ncbi:intercellular trafficking and secretion [Homalodisca vitripennis]|nr:intercellular trafficking and secretion [Homalodisca vitripennis]
MLLTMYLFFSGSLQALCRRQELLQYELEQAQENIKNKEQEKIRVQQGRSGLMSRLFGSVETEEVRDMKLNQLEARIQVGEQAVQDCKLALSQGHSVSSPVGRFRDPVGHVYLPYLLYFEPNGAVVR